MILTKIKRPVRNKHVGFDAVICNGDYLMRASRTISFVASGLLAFFITFSTSAAEDPGRNAWRQYASPEEAGFSSERLEEAYASAEEAGSAAIMAIYNGRVVVAWGDIERPFKCHSVRKSILSALYGTHVAAGRIDLNATLADLGINDIEPLSDEEKTARIADLLTARSGVYHRAAKEPAGMSRNRPARHSHKPGEHFWYNNWDFNTLGTIYHQLTGEPVIESFQQHFADPLGMQDFIPEHGSYELEPRRSKHPAYAFRLSARDLARFGLMIAQGGRWGDERIVPESWITQSTRTHSTFDNLRGYGYMWWIYPAGSTSSYETVNKYDVFSAIGTGGQLVIVIPEAKFVLVHRGDTDNRRKRVTDGLVWQILEMILSAKTGDAKTAPALTDVTAVPLPGALPAPPTRTAIDLDPAKIREYIGTYANEETMTMELYEYAGRLFGQTNDGREAEIFAEAEDKLFLKNADVQLRILRDETGRITDAEVTMMGQTLKLPRVSSGIDDSLSSLGNSAAK